MAKAVELMMPDGMVTLDETDSDGLLCAVRKQCDELYTKWQRCKRHAILAELLHTILIFERLVGAAGTKAEIAETRRIIKKLRACYECEA